MTFVIIRAVVVAAVVWVALSQLRSTHHLLAWELVVLAVALWEVRALPTGQVRGDHPLFGTSSSPRARLPRAVSSTEWMVLDAITGRTGPDRRLQPALRRIAEHRLHLHGLDFDSPAASALLGEREWTWLATATAEAPDPDLIDELVSKLENL